MFIVALIKHRNVRGILEQLRAELKREENRRNELEREFLQQKIVWDRERKELHEEIFELQRTERMWLEHGDQSDARFVPSFLSLFLTDTLALV